MERDRAKVQRGSNVRPWPRVRADKGPRQENTRYGRPTNITRPSKQKNSRAWRAMATSIPSESSPSSSSSSSAAPASLAGSTAAAPPPDLGDAENNRTSADRRGDPAPRGELILPAAPDGPPPLGGRTVGTTLWMMPASGGADEEGDVDAAGAAALAEPHPAEPLAPVPAPAAPLPSAAGGETGEAATGESLRPSPPRTDVGVVSGTAGILFPGGRPDFRAAPLPVGAVPFSNDASRGGTTGVVPVIAASGKRPGRTRTDPPAPPARTSRSAPTSESMGGRTTGTTTLSTPTGSRARREQEQRARHLTGAVAGIRWETQWRHEGADASGGATSEAECASVPGRPGGGGGVGTSQQQSRRLQSPKTNALRRGGGGGWTVEAG